MAVRSYWCCGCDKLTVHDEISYAEFQASDKHQGKLESVACSFGDYVGITKAMKLLSSFNGYYRCRECGRCTPRNKRGETDWDYDI